VEILYCVIEQTDDRKTLGSWKQTCSTFKEFVESRHWYALNVSGNQILVRGAIKFRPPSQILFETEPSLENNRIKTLHLTTSYGTPAGMEGERGDTLIALSIARMIAAGTKSIPSIKTVIQKGVLWQDALDQIVSKWKSLSVLQVRYGTHHTTKRSLISSKAAPLLVFGSSSRVSPNSKGCDAYAYHVSFQARVRG